MASPGFTCLTKAYIGRNMNEIFLSETMWPRALMYGVKYQLVDLHQVCSNFFPAAKNGLASGSHVSQRPIWGKT